jgi:hypothetical protein
VGTNPNRLALSQDGAYLYVGADGINSVQRINLASSTIDETISLGSDTSGHQLTAGDIEVMPGFPGTIAVVRGLNRVIASPAAVDVAVFDGTTMRPNTTPPFQTTGLTIDLVAFSDSGNVLYGVDSESSASSFTRMNVDSSGVSVQDSTRLLFGTAYGASLVYNSGFMYSTSGTVLNPSTLILQGKFPANPSLTPGESVVVEGGVPYLLVHGPYGAVITAYNSQTFLETATSAVDISGSDDEASLVKCGNSCFAFIDYAGAPNVTTSVVISNAALTPVTGTPTLDNLTPNHILWNAGSGRLYASIPAAAGPWGNSVAIINPSSQTVESTIFVGSDPDVLALSGDGAFLYVGLDGSASVARIDLATSALDLTFFLGLDPIIGGPTLPASVSVSPSDSNTIAVARINTNVQPNNEIVAIYQQGVLLPNTTNDGNLIAFCDSGSVLYGTDNQVSLALFTMSVSSTGLQQTGAATGLIGRTLNIICESNVIYATTGYTADPLADKQLGIFPGLINPVALAVDDPNKKVFFLDNGSGTPSVVGFDQTSYGRTGALSVTAATSMGHDLARWGTNGFAVATQNQLILVTGALP